MFAADFKKALSMLLLTTVAFAVPLCLFSATFSVSDMGHAEHAGMADHGAMAVHLLHAQEMTSAVFVSASMLLLSLLACLMLLSAVYTLVAENPLALQGYIPWRYRKESGQVKHKWFRWFSMLLRSPSLLLSA